MTTAIHDARAAAVPAPDPTMPARRLLLRVNGGFLAAVGALQVTFELVSHYTGEGIYGDIFEGSGYTIGWVENHGLALVIGLILITIAAREPRRLWHAYALAVHVFLGGANLVFWDAFVGFDTTVAGVLATIAHALFAGAHTVALIVSRRPSLEEAAR